MPKNAKSIKAIMSKAKKEAKDKANAAAPCPRTRSRSRRSCPRPRRRPRTRPMRRLHAQEREVDQGDHVQGQEGGQGQGQCGGSMPKNAKSIKAIMSKAKKEAKDKANAADPCPRT